MSRCSTFCCTVSLVSCLRVLIVNVRWADRGMCILGNCRLCAWWKFKLEATIFISFVIVLLSFFVEFVNTLICCFIWYCILIVLLILPQDPNNRSSAATTIEDGVCASPRITTSFNSPVGKVPEGSMFKRFYYFINFFLGSISELRTRKWGMWCIYHRVR